MKNFFLLLFVVNSVWCFERTNHDERKLIFLPFKELTSVPEELRDRTDVQRLKLFRNNIEQLPVWIRRFQALQELDLAFNRLQSFPDELGNCNNLQILNLSNNRISTLPACIGRLKALTYLDVSVNTLASLPDELSNCTNLQSLHLSRNAFTELPTCVCALTGLKRLVLSLNKLKTLPDDIEKLSQLESLILLRNQLKRLPSTFTKLAQLRLVTLNNNDELQLSSEQIEMLKSFRLADLHCLVAKGLTYETDESEFRSFSARNIKIMERGSAREGLRPIATNDIRIADEEKCTKLMATTDEATFKTDAVADRSMALQLYFKQKMKQRTLASSGTKGKTKSPYALALRLLQEGKCIKQNDNGVFMRCPEGKLFYINTDGAQLLED